MSTLFTRRHYEFLANLCASVEDPTFERNICRGLAAQPNFNNTKFKQRIDILIYQKRKALQQLESQTLNVPELASNLEAVGLNVTILPKPKRRPNPTATNTPSHSYE